jgi:hypothetical protein
MQFIKPFNVITSLCVSVIALILLALLYSSLLCYEAATSNLLPIVFWETNFALMLSLYFTLLYFTLLYFTLLYFTLLYFTLLNCYRF